jgi:hypothetical protein
MSPVLIPTIPQSSASAACTLLQQVDALPAVFAE